MILPVSWITDAALFVFGAAVGSFLNVCIYRLPAGVPSFFPVQAVRTAKTSIRWFDNIPILGFLLLEAGAGPAAGGSRPGTPWSNCWRASFPFSSPTGSD